MKNRKDLYQTIIISFIAGIIIGWLLIKINSSYVIYISIALFSVIIVTHKQSIQYQLPPYTSFFHTILNNILKHTKVIYEITIYIIIISIMTLFIFLIMNYNKIILEPIILIIFVISTASITILLSIRIAEKFGLVDISISQRKFHSGRIPLIGGVSIYAGLVMGISLFITPNVSSLTYLLCSSVLVALGVADDVKDLSPRFRLLVQSLVAVFMSAGSGIYIHSLGDIFGLGVIDLGGAGYVVTILAVIAAINAFNMIDGIDGLLGISSLITFASMGILFSLNHDVDNMKLALIISVALVPYLISNLGLTTVKFKKIFMGDTGSILIGFTVVWLLIQGTQAGDGEKASFSAATALWLIAFPLMDMVRVIGDRVRRGKSPFYADRSHLHHILQDSFGDSKRTALLKICTLSVFFAAAGVLMHVNSVREVVMFGVFLVGFLFYWFKTYTLQR